MATPKALEALQKTKEALAGIKSKLEPVLAKLQDDSLERGTRAQGHATVALSLGMMKYMGARLRGLDQGRKPDDPLRQELNNMRKVLAELKEKYKDKEEKKDNPSFQYLISRSHTNLEPCHGRLNNTKSMFGIIYLNLIELEIMPLICLHFIMIPPKCVSNLLECTILLS